MYACEMQRKQGSFFKIWCAEHRGMGSGDGESWLLFLQPGAGVAVEGGRHTGCQPLESSHQDSW